LYALKLNGSKTGRAWPPGTVRHLRTIIIYLTITRVFRCGAPLLLAAAAAAAADPATHRYDVSVDATLDTLHVTARFASPVDDIRARSGRAQRYLLNARDCDTGDIFQARGRHLELPSNGTVCLRYDVDLRRAAAAESRNTGLDASNVIVSPAAWLWRPPPSADARIVVRFDPDTGTGVSVPWRPLAPDADAFEVSLSPRNASAPVAFGNFVATRESVPGATLRIALLRPRGGFDAAALAAWLRQAADNVTLAYGRFPNPLPQVVVVPVGHGSSNGDSPVPFGHVVRDGGESVELFIDERRPIADFYDDWTATHEFSHLMLPYLVPADRWIAEGFAQYYQNVLLARSGQYDALRAWQKLYEGFERGRLSRPELSPVEAARAGVGAATMKIYWSGAIVALLADVELRERSGGRESLDTVLDRLQRCCLPADRGWTGPELFAMLDGFVRQPVFMPLYRRYANAAGFPDIGPLFARLGIVVVDGRIEFDDDAELAGIRRAITAYTDAGA